MIALAWSKPQSIRPFIIIVMLAVAIPLVGCGGSSSSSSGGGGFPTARPAQPASPAPYVEVKRVQVDYTTAGKPLESLPQDATRAVHENDLLTLKDQADAMLHLSLYLIHLFHTTEVKAEAAGTTPLSDLSLTFGTLFAKQAREAKAGEYLEIRTETATIRSLGTDFLVYYNPRDRVTWVVVQQDRVAVQGAGVTVTVSAGWQTWVEAGRAPAPPAPALRSDIGARFPTIESLTNGSMSDTQLLPNLTTCTVTRDPAISVEVRNDSNSAAQVIGTMPRDKLFGAISRSADSRWVKGYGGDQQTVGWVRIEAITCILPATSLPVDGTTPTPTPPAPPPPPATATPSPRPPTPTSTRPPTARPPSPTPTAVACVDALRLVSERTVPDGPNIPFGQEFRKTWRIMNVGNCPWAAGYRLVFDSGDQMGGHNVTIGQVVKPGATIDVTAPLVAPLAPGQYQGTWKMANAAGATFGDPLTVRIRVAATPTPVPTPTRTPTARPTPTPTPTPRPIPMITIIPMPGIGPVASSPISIELDSAVPDPVQYGTCPTEYKTLVMNAVMNVEPGEVREVRLEYTYHTDRQVSKLYTVMMSALADKIVVIGTPDAKRQKLLRSFGTAIDVGTEWPLDKGGPGWIEYRIVATGINDTQDSKTGRVTVTYCGPF